MRTTALLALSVLASFAPLLPAAEPSPAPAALPVSGSKPTIFVAPLTGDLSQIQGWQPALGEGLAEMLVTQLAKSGRFDVVESTHLADLVDEIRLGEAGYVAEGEAVQKGGFAGADYMFVGKVTRFGSKAQDINLGGFIPGSGGGLGVKTSQSDVQINWRVVDAASRIAKATGSAVGKENGVGFDVGVGVDGRGGRIGFGNKEFMNSALGKATVKALDQVMADVLKAPLPPSGRRQQQENAAAAKARAAQEAAAALKKQPGTVLAVPGGGIAIVSLGSASGWKTGDKVRLYETTEIKNSEGAVVFTEKKLRGEAVMEDVQEQSAKVRVPEGLQPAEGWVAQAD